MKVLIFYSGGKDSQASLIWAAKKYGVDMCEAVFCDTKWENPVTYDHIIETCNQLGVKIVNITSEKYDGMIGLAKKKKRFPSTKARFCTEELKAIPAINYVLSHTENLIIVEGIRKNESFERSKMQAECTYFKYYYEPIRTNSMLVEMYLSKDFLTAAQRAKLIKAQERLKKGKEDPKYHTHRKADVFEWSKKFNADKIRPIFNWTAIEAIDYIRENGQQPNPLYFMGFTRVGCFPCIMSNHGSTRLIIENHPEQWDKLKAVEKEVGSSFFPPGYIPKQHTTGRTKSGKRFATAQDVERYLKAKNATLDMFEEDTPGCMSAYNLCE